MSKSYWTEERSQKLFDYRRFNPNKEWKEIGKHLGRSGEGCRKHYGLNPYDIEVIEPETTSTATSVTKNYLKDGSCVLHSESTFIKTLPDLMEYSETDLKIWYVESHNINMWEVAAKNNEGEMVKVPLYQIKAKLKLIIKTFTESRLEAILHAIKQHSPNYKKFPNIIIKKEGYLSEVAIFDMHIAKLAWDQECGENYDTEIATQLFRAAIEHSLAMTKPYHIERFLFPIGNDFFHTDNPDNTTTKGTRQDVDSRDLLAFQIGESLIIQAVERLQQIAPVDIVIVPGNHEEQKIFFLGEFLKAWFRQSDRVTIDNKPRPRKVYQFGKSMIAFSHGDKVKAAKLALIIPQEFQDIYGVSNHVEIHTGHLHKKTVDVFGKIVVRGIPSLCGSDKWHTDFGWINGFRCAETHLFTKEGGYGGYVPSSIINMKSFMGT